MQRLAEIAMEINAIGKILLSRLSFLDDMYTADAGAIQRINISNKIGIDTIPTGILTPATWANKKAQLFVRPSDQRERMLALVMS